MNYILMPMLSLERRALIKTAIMLWNIDDIKDLLARFYIHPSDSDKWLRLIEDRVIEKVQELPLPKSLKEKVLDFIKPIGVEIKECLKCHKILAHGITFVRVRESLNKLCWTPQWTVDKKKMVESLVRDENLDITNRYVLACLYCLENDIVTLWNKMPPNCRKSFYNENNPSEVKRDRLVVFWTYDIKGEVTKLDNMFESWGRLAPYQYAFTEAVFSDNKVATEYFWQKLTSEEREETFVSSAQVCRENVGIFLLSKINEEQQIELLAKRPRLLESFLNWPWQGFFMETAKRMWTSLDTDDYSYLLEQIICKVHCGFKDYNYQKLFSEFWQQSPVTHKRDVIDSLWQLDPDRFGGGYMPRGLARYSSLFDLFHIKDRDNIELILKDTTARDREMIIFSGQSINTCKALIYKDEMDLVEFFVRECISSKDVMIKFKKRFERYIIRNWLKEIQEKEKGKFNKFFQLLNDLIQKYDEKRELEEDNSGPAKRLCLTSENPGISTQ